MTFLRETPDGIEISVWVVPGANRSEVVGVHDGSLRVRLAASPSGGQANRALVHLMSEVTGGRIELLRGGRARRKVVRVTGVAKALLVSRLGGG